MLDLSLEVGAERCADAPRTMRVPPACARFVIGRDPACDWALPDRTLALSARHCEIVPTATGALLRDLSTNGTFVNGGPARIDGEVLLRDGDRIEMGPYTVAIRIAVVPPATAPATPPSATSKTVEDTTPIVMAAGRGRDPAAVASPLPEAEDLGLTRIRPVPAADGGQPSAPPPMPVAATVHRRMALALGLPADALDDLPEDLLLARVGQLACAAVEALRQQMDAQARLANALESRRTARLSSTSPLQLAPDTAQALRDLIAGDPAAVIRGVAVRLAAQPPQLLEALQDAGRRLGQDLHPASLARALPGADAAAREAGYAALWQRLGVTEPGADWADGFQAAWRRHLAAAFDDPGGA